MKNPRTAARQHGGLESGGGESWIGLAAEFAADIQEVYGIEDRPGRDLTLVIVRGNPHLPVWWDLEVAVPERLWKEFRIGLVSS